MNLPVFTILVIGVGWTLSGCTTPGAAITKPPAEVSLKNANTQARVLGFTEPVVRSYTEVDGKKNEVIGANCTLDSAELSGVLVTPSKVRLPEMKGKPTPLYVTCRTDTLAGAKEVAPALRGTAVGGPSVAGLAAAIISSAIVASRDKWGYSSTGATTSVTMKAPALPQSN